MPDGKCGDRLLSYLGLSATCGQWTRRGLEPVHSLWDTDSALSFSLDCPLPKPVEERKGRFFWLKLELAELKLESSVIEDVTFHHIVWILTLVSFTLRTFFLTPKEYRFLRWYRFLGCKTYFKPPSEQRIQVNSPLIIIANKCQNRKHAQHKQSFDCSGNKKIFMNVFFYNMSLLFVIAYIRLL